jgi:hypothetical protein
MVRRRGNPVEAGIDSLMCECADAGRRPPGLARDRHRREISPDSWIRLYLRLTPTTSAGTNRGRTYHTVALN